MTGKKKPSAAVLYEIERHCNNYFNPRNDPNITERKYPPAFLDLACKIEAFLNDESQLEFKSSLTSVNEGGVSISKDVVNNSWIKLFARELAVYKRVKFI